MVGNSPEDRMPGKPSLQERLAQTCDAFRDACKRAVNERPLPEIEPFLGDYEPHEIAAVRAALDDISADLGRESQSPAPTSDAPGNGAEEDRSHASRLRQLLRWWRGHVAVNATFSEVQQVVGELSSDQQRKLVHALDAVARRFDQRRAAKTVGSDSEQTLDLSADKREAPRSETHREQSKPAAAEIPATLPPSDQSTRGSTDETISPCESATAEPSGGATLDYSLDPEDESSEGVGNKLPNAFDGLEVLEELGRGGMGVVYKARDQSTDRVVCVKMMLAGNYASKGAMRRFQVEIESAAQIEHPNIVPVYRAGQVDGKPYFVMRYVPGVPLDDYARNELASQPKKAVMLVSKICRAIQFAHNRGILHRDLKPANILVDDQGEPHITDFGLAKRVDEDDGYTKTGMVMGTPDYMSPEQAVGAIKLVSVTSDVYSLGSILFDLLTGEPPFKSSTIVETLTRLTKEPARTPTVINKKIGRDLETICLKCLEKEPKNRYASAAELADELDRYLKGEPILGRPVGRAERLWRWSRRNPGIASLSAALLLLLIAAAVGSTIAAFTINRQKNRAVELQELADERASDAERASNAAELSAKVANDQRQLALETLRNLVTKVEETLRDRSDLGDLRKGILEDALAGLSKVSRTAENVGLADRSVGVARQRMGDIYEQIGKSEEALAEHQAALDIFERLSQAMPGPDEAEWLTWNKAISHDQLGRIGKRLKTDEAETLEHFHRAKELRESLLSAAVIHATDIPRIKRYHSLAISESNIGSLLLDGGNTSAAREHFLRSIEHCEAMLAIDENSLDARQALAGVQFNLGQASFRLKELDDTAKYYNKALQVRRELYEEDKRSVRAKSDLASCYEAIGDLELQTGEPDESLRHYQQSYPLRVELHEQNPSDAKLHSLLGTLFYRLATANYRLGSSESDEQYAECLAIRESLFNQNPKDLSFRINLMLAQARCGKHIEAVKTAQLLSDAALRAKNSTLAFYGACGYALSSQAVGYRKSDDELSDDERQLRDDYAEKAVLTITKGIEFGYRDVYALEVDPDLEPIQQRSDYKQAVDALKMSISQPPKQGD